MATAVASMSGVFDALNREFSASCCSAGQFTRAIVDAILGQQAKVRRECSNSSNLAACTTPEWTWKKTRISCKLGHHPPLPCPRDRPTYKLWKPRATWKKMLLSCNHRHRLAYQMDLRTLTERGSRKTCPSYIISHKHGQARRHPRAGYLDQSRLSRKETAES